MEKQRYVHENEEHWQSEDISGNEYILESWFACILADSTLTDALKDTFLEDVLYIW